jgi:hypothetical protein
LGYVPYIYALVFISNKPLHHKILKMTTFHTETGFSIELAGYKLLYRGQYEGFPLYEVLEGQVTAVAIVDKPAIGIGTVVNPTDKTLAGPVMIPNLKIFRLEGPTGPENCYWYFSADTIKTLQKSFKGEMKFGH